MSDDDFVVANARNVVSDLAPDELALFDPVSRAYRRDPKKVMSDRGRPGSVLGSGIDVAIALVSPVALAVASAVYDRLVEKAGEAVVEGGGRLLKRLGRKKNTVGGADNQAQAFRPEITADQLDELRTLAVERAKELGLPDDEAERVGDAMRASLEREL